MMPDPNTSDALGTLALDFVGVMTDFVGPFLAHYEVPAILAGFVVTSVLLSVMGWVRSRG